MLRNTKLSVLAAVVAACAIGASSASAAWTVVSGTPPSTAAQFQGVACTSTTFCVLVGPQSSPSAYAQKWNGTTLSTVSAASTTSEFDGVGCNSSTLCFASGTDTSSRSAREESFNGTSFSASTSTNPSGSTFTQLSGTACPGSTSCFSVGQYTSASGTQPVIEHWTGTSWGLMTMTLPSGAVTASLSDVSCTATTACTAVGWYTNASGTQLVLIERYNGTAWTAQTPATISGPTASELDGVSCTSSTSCNAVGSYTDAASVEHELAETWNGTTWTQKTVPAPSGSTGGALSDISCYTTATAGCVAVGSYTDASGNVQPEVAGYNGTSYTQQSISRPASATDTTLNGISCTSSTFCMIAGTATYTSTGIGPVAYKGP